MITDYSDGLRVWVDTDVALGAPDEWRSRDVDDGFALAALLRSRKIELAGISTVFGNSRADRSAVAARALVGSAVEVIEGAARPERDSPAAEAIAGLPAGTPLVCLGPLTNVAAALARNPSLAVELLVVGGNLDSLGRWPPYWPFEFNLAKDAPSARTVFATRLARRIYPLDACRHLTVGPAALARLVESSDPLARALAHGSRGWQRWSLVRYRSREFPVWDLVPALDLCGLLDGTFDLRRLRLSGRGLLDPDASAIEARCLRKFDAAAALERFLRLLGA